MTQDQDNTTAASVALKLPTFWAEQPIIWFTQAESQFALKGIVSDDTKYHHIIASLDQQTATRIIDFLQHPPTQEKYNSLKSRLLQTYTLSEYERAGRLLHSSELGDEKPSVLMDRMLALLQNGETPCFLFKRIFLERLPEDIRAPLVGLIKEDCREIAKKLILCGVQRKVPVALSQQRQHQSCLK